MRIEYELTPDDWAEFGEYCARTSPGFQRAKYVGVVVGLLLIVACSVLMWQRAEGIWWLVIGAFTAFAWGVFWPRHLVSHARAHMSRRQLPCLSGRHVMEPTPAALVAKCDITESSTRWAGIQNVTETTRHVFVMLSDVQGYVVPKARIVSGDANQFIREAQQFWSASKTRPSSGSR